MDRTVQENQEVYSHEFKRTYVKRVVVKQKRKTEGKDISWKDQIMSLVYGGIMKMKKTEKSKEAEILSL